MEKIDIVLNVLDEVEFRTDMVLNNKEDVAERIADLAKEMELEIRDVYLIINRIPRDSMDNPRIKELRNSGK